MDTYRVILLLEARPIATLKVEGALENWTINYQGELPDGSYELYLPTTLRPGDTVINSRGRIGTVRRIGLVEINWHDGGIGYVAPDTLRQTSKPITETETIE